jgi:ribonuclease D
MKNNYQATPEIISNPERLEGLVREYVREEVVAFDLEADSMHHYREKVCLVQIAASPGVFLIDPLSFSDMSPLAVLLGDSRIRKVFHGADYDVRSLRRDFSLKINNLFDTMIACQFLGEREVGLAAVLRKRFGVELDKRFQKADWSKRPLDPAMMEYAVADTALLVPLYMQLEEELKYKGRLSWVEEESALVSRVRVAERNKEPFFIRFKGADKMDGRTLAVLEELLRLRDARARLSDRPPFKILSNETLAGLAEKKPVSHTELHGVTGLSAKLADRYGDEILRAVRKGVETPEAGLPQYPRSIRPRKSGAAKELFGRLKQWREKKALELGMEAGVVANNNLLDALSEAAPHDEDGLDNIPILRIWQKREFGVELLKVLNEAGCVS